MELRVNKQRIADIIKADAVRELPRYEPCSSGCCDYPTERAFLDNSPVTLFQAQLVKAGACVEGRARVGAKSAREWWETSDDACDMRWLLGTLCGIDYEQFPNSFFSFTVSGNNGNSEACNNIRAAYPFARVRELSGKAAGL